MATRILLGFKYKVVNVLHKLYTTFSALVAAAAHPQLYNNSMFRIV
jgi:hypothetical protein